MFAKSPSLADGIGETALHPKFVFVKRILKLNDEITTFSIKSATDVMIFKNIFDKKFSEKIGVLTQNKAKLCTNLIITLVFEKTPIFSPKIVENRRKL
jgi:hypothetical protein